MWCHKMIVFGKDFFGRWSCSLNRRIWGGDEFTFHPQEYKGHTFSDKGDKTMNILRPHQELPCFKINQIRGLISNHYAGGGAPVSASSGKEPEKSNAEASRTSWISRGRLLQLLWTWWFQVFCTFQRISVPNFFLGGGGEELRSGLCGTGRVRKDGQRKPHWFFWGDGLERSLCF